MRNISPQIFTDEFIGTQSMRLRLLWMGLILTMADDQGRLLYKPILIRLSVFPYDQNVLPRDVDSDLLKLKKANKIVIYSIKGDNNQYIQILKWWTYQVSSQWAKRSAYPAPPKWVDRVRCHEKGSGTKPVTVNWEHPGGFSKPLGSGNVAPSKRLASREDEDEDIPKDEASDDEEPTYLPTSLPKTKARQVAGQETKNKKTALTGTFEEQIKKLKPKQRNAATFVHRVFGSSGLRNPKLVDLSLQVATRRYNGGLTSMVLGALASSYADANAKNKSAIAAHRLENEQIAPEYKKPDAWDVLPVDVLRAAGIDDLRSYRITKQLEGMQ